MALKPYDLCPGGTGKKLKFCCADLLGELDKIQRMTEADQRIAALDYLEKLEQRFPNRACLVTQRVQLQMGTGAFEEAYRGLSRLLRDQPHNPVALGLMVVVQAALGQETKALRQTLELAVNHDSRPHSPYVVGAIATFCMHLIESDEPIAARAHVDWLLELDPQHPHGQQMLDHLRRSPQHSLISKNEWRLLPAPESAPWKDEFQAALNLAQQRRWLAAIDKLANLTQRTTNAPAIWFNLGLLRAWAGDDPGAVRALRRYAALDLPVDDAVEAEALAQELSDEADQVDHLEIIWPIADWERILALVGHHPRLPQVPVPTPEEAPEAPLPKLGALLLDRAPAEQADDVALADVPRVVATLWFFSRETDRPARLEATASAPEIEDVRAAVGEVLADAVEAPGDPEPFDSVDAEEALFSRRLFAVKTSPATRQRLVQEHFAATFLEGWTALPQARLNGQTPLEAVGDPQGRLRVLGSLLVWETGANVSEEQLATVAAVRSRLGLPAPAAPRELPASTLALLKLRLVDPTTLADEELFPAAARLLVAGNYLAARRFGDVLLTREAVPPATKASFVVGLAHIAKRPEAALESLSQGRAFLKEAHESTAKVDLIELSVFAAMQDGESFSRRLRQITQEFGKDMWVMQELRLMLEGLGLLRAGDGIPTNEDPLEGEVAAEVVGVDGPRMEAGKIWTPESARADAPRPALWTPGMQ